MSPYDLARLNIAKQTLEMPPAMVAVMGGMSHAEAAQVVATLTTKATRKIPRPLLLKTR